MQNDDQSYSQGTLHLASPYRSLYIPSHRGRSVQNDGQSVLTAPLYTPPNLTVCHVSGNERLRVSVSDNKHGGRGGECDVGGDRVG